jgi:uncharacterized linocin/CFP29 family protein
MTGLPRSCGIAHWRARSGRCGPCGFAIERQCLVPMYRHIVIEADNLDEACKKALSDDIDWDTQEMDCDSARATTITEAKVIPEGYEADQTHGLIIASRDPKDLPLDMLSLATFLYGDEAKTGLLLEIPAKFTDDE